MAELSDWQRKLLIEHMVGEQERKMVSKLLGLLERRILDKSKAALEAMEQERAEKVRAEDEIRRTCPWCGSLFPTVAEMEAHEADCD